jgi:hypothetical protein
LTKRIQLEEGLGVGLAAARDDLLNPVHAHVERLVADHGVDLLFARRHVLEDTEGAGDGFALGVLVVAEPPRSLEDRLPAGEHLLIERRRLKPELASSSGTPAAM